MSAVLVAMGLFLVSASADEQKVVLDGSSTVGPIAKALAKHYMAKHPDVKVTVNESGSGNGVKALIHGTCDIATMSRFMKEHEFSAAFGKGVTPVAHVVAMDGLSVLVHPDNPVTDLTIDQIRDIYSGKITNWKTVGGPDREIVVICRPPDSGTRDVFHRVVMTHVKDGKKIRVKITAGAECVGSNAGIRARVQTTPAAIGYAGLGFVDKTVKALDINGVHPAPEAVMDGRYPVARPLFMVTSGYPKPGTHLHGFVTLHLSGKGQEIVRGIGFVPVTEY